MAMLRRPHEHLSSDPNLLHAGTEDDVRGLAERVLDPERVEPVVCLTSRPGENYPALDPAEVRPIVGSDTDVFFLQHGSLTFALKSRLPEAMDVYGGAIRLWWTGLDGESDPSHHPLIHDASGVYGSQTLRAFEAAWRRGPHSTEPGRRVDPVAALREGERDGARAEIELLRREVAELRERVDRDGRSGKRRRGVSAKRRPNRPSRRPRPKPSRRSRLGSLSIKT